ncbi:hypothetical protein C8Q73DRAFT_65681 [Cubamyces lactineus]|nr:hypothetical protein C8Q73DRAFT_65681 [Cubamyces lactineus]
MMPCALYRNCPLLNPAHVCTSSHCILLYLSVALDSISLVLNLVNVCRTCLGPLCTGPLARWASASGSMPIGPVLLTFLTTVY